MEEGCDEETVLRMMKLFCKLIVVVVVTQIYKRVTLHGTEHQKKEMST